MNDHQFVKKSALPFAYQGGVILTTVDPDLREQKENLNWEYNLKKDILFLK